MSNIVPFILTLMAVIGVGGYILFKVVKFFKAPSNGLPAKSSHGPVPLASTEDSEPMGDLDNPYDPRCRFFNPSDIRIANDPYIRPFERAGTLYNPIDEDSPFGINMPSGFHYKD